MTKNTVILFLMFVILVLVVIIMSAHTKSELKKKVDDTVIGIGDTIIQGVKTYGDVKNNVNHYIVGSPKFLGEARIQEIPDSSELKENYRKKFVSSTPGKGYAHEELCRGVFEGIYGVPFPKARPKFLANPLTNYKSNLELDGYNEDLNLAFEYNGEGHYNPNFYSNKTAEDFQGILMRDKIKRELCNKHGVWLVTIPYTVKPKDIRRYILDNLP